MLQLRSSAIVAAALGASLSLAAVPARADEPATTCDTRSRWIAALPFGAGQFQNRDVGLGVFFAVAEAALGGTAVATVVAVNAMASSGRIAPEYPALNRDIRTATTVNHMAFASWAALTVVGVIEAEMSFGARRRAAGRESAPAIVTTVATVPGGGMVGVRVAF